MTKIYHTYNPLGRKINKALYGLCLILLALVSCKKEVTSALPDNTEDIALNFHTVSDVMDAAYSPSQSSVAIYVDKYVQQPNPISSGSGYPFPTFSFGFKGGHDYPASNNGNINYARFVSGAHRLMFTDATNTIVLDTTINAVPKSFNTLYLADVLTAPGSEAAYKLVAVEEPRNVPDDKTGIRFINLSPDAGSITCSLQKADGSLAATQAGELAFGQVSPYQFFGSEITSDGLLRFTLSNATNGLKFNTGTSFNPGKSYVIVISGFRTDQQRMVNTGKNPDGSLKKEVITIGNNLKAEILTSH